MVDRLKALSLASSLKATGLALAISIASSFAPAMANANSASDSFRITEEKLEENETALGKADAEFRSIHNDWGKAVGTPSHNPVSVPSIDPVKSMRLSSSFGRRRAPMRGASRNHKGIDIPGPVGTPIYATADGVVGRAKWLRGYGKYIEINHGNEIQTRYAHMSALNAYAGKNVKKGDIIGYMGSTGNSTGSHLHYEVRISGVAVNPISFLSPDKPAKKSDGEKTKLLLADKQVDTTAAGGSEE